MTLERTYDPDEAMLFHTCYLCKDLVWDKIAPEHRLTFIWHKRFPDTFGIRGENLKVPIERERNVRDWTMAEVENYILDRRRAHAWYQRKFHKSTRNSKHSQWNPFDPLNKKKFADYKPEIPSSRPRPPCWYSDGPPHYDVRPYCKHCQRFLKDGLDYFPCSASENGQHEELSEKCVDCESVMWRRDNPNAIPPPPKPPAFLGRPQQNPKELITRYLPGSK